MIMPSIFQREDNARIITIYEANRAALTEHFNSDCTFKGRKPTKASDLMDDDYMDNCYTRDFLEAGKCPLCSGEWGKR